MKLTLRRPDDMHVHLREGNMLRLVAPHTAKHFARALVMPNLAKPIVTGADVARYREEVIAAAGPGYQLSGFTPLMTIKLLDGTTPATIFEARAAGAIAAKLYPRGVTTNSEDGVARPLALDSVYAAMEECGMVLCLHGETPGVFCMDRERVFLSDLGVIYQAHPKLKIILEHITTADAIEAVQQLDNVAATITVHHLVHTLDDVVGDKLQPHHFCKPIAKTPADRDALRKAATSGNPKFFLGTDSAPHAVNQKECASGCAGVFSAPVALAMLAGIFEEEEALDKLEAFTSEFGARFYGLPLNEGTLELVREEWDVPDALLVTCEPPPTSWLRPLAGGTTLSWRVA